MQEACNSNERTAISEQRLFHMLKGIGIYNERMRKRVNCTDKSKVIAFSATCLLSLLFRYFYFVNYHTSSIINSDCTAKFMI